LMSAPSQQARWRILVMHHPYTDVFNNRHIVPIAERCGVDLFLGGHLHRYVKAVSVNPDIGARTVYVMQGSLQDPAEGYDEGVPECRLLEEFPEVIAMGRNNYGILDISADALDCRFFGFRSDGSRTLVDTVHLEHGEPQLVFENIHLRRLDNDGHVEIRADASNTGTVLAAVVMELSDNGCKKKLNLFGEPWQSRIVLLAPGEQRNVSAVYQARTPGAHRIACGDAEEEIFVFEPKELSFSHMRIVPLQGDKADCIYAAIEAVNNLDREIYTTVPLYIDQRIAATQSCFFRAHERRLLHFCHAFRRGGSYQISIADQLPEEICIEGSIRIIPRVLDKSGNGHYALLQGSPKIVEVNGQREVRLESYGDYIEIPPFPGLVAPQGFTGIVRA
ncbi:MAG: metallophosphoesterase, partial [Selenomonas sp.]|nr:metallophosphoesterase [Selenomonas sp.]